MADDKKTSKFSSGINIIMRIDILWKDTHLHSRNGQYEKWNSDLDRIWLELARDLKENNYKDKKQDLKSIEDKLYKHKNFYDKSPDGFGKLPSNFHEKRNEIYKILMEKQEFLSRLENELGKGTTFYDEDEDDFD